MCQALHCTFFSPVGKSEHACSGADGGRRCEQSNQLLQTGLQLTQICKRAVTFIYQWLQLKRLLETQRKWEEREITDGSLPLTALSHNELRKWEGFYFPHLLKKSRSSDTNVFAKGCYFGHKNEPSYEETNHGCSFLWVLNIWSSETCLKIKFKISVSWKSGQVVLAVMLKHLQLY